MLRLNEKEVGVWDFFCLVGIKVDIFFFKQEAAYGMLRSLVGSEMCIRDRVWPSTGNYGIGGAYVGCRMDFDSVIILPQDMSLFLIHI
mgnify:CR=1 FL=1